MAAIYNGGALESILGFKTECVEGNPKHRSRSNIVPAIPPLVLCAIALWCASAALYVLLENESVDTLKKLCVAFIVVSVIACIAFAICRNLILCVFLFLALGCVLGASGSLEFHEKSNDLPSDGEYELVLKDDPRAYSRGSYATVACNLEVGRSINLRAFFVEETDLLDNARISAKCKFSKPSDEFAHSSYLSDLHAQANIESYEVLEKPFIESAIYDIREKAIALLSEHGAEQAGLLQALICGYRPTIMESGAYEDYKKCGIAHIVAVSGAHLAIVTMAVGLMFKALRFPRFLYVAITLMFVFAYLLFSGMPISAMRAAIMCSLFLVSGLAKRRNATLNSLSVCAILFILLDPACCVSVSFFLSATSTFGIALFASLFSEWSIEYPRVIQNLFAAPLSMTVASNVVTLPFSVSMFGMLPVISPIANILVAPIFTLVCVSGVIALVLSFVLPSLSSAFVGFVAICAQPLTATASYLSSIPNACISMEAEIVPMLVISAVIVFVLYRLKPRISGKHLIIPLITIVAFCGFSFIRTPATTDDRIAMLDVGQGDAFVIESKGVTLLIDTGNDAEKLRKSLNHIEIDGIEAVSITHPDSDHCESMIDIKQLYKNAKFLCARQLLECECKKCTNLERDARSLFGDHSVMGIDVGDAFDIGNFKVKVLWPEVFKDAGGNADSLCLFVTLDSDYDGKVDWRALFTGDAESEELQRMTKNNRIGDIDVLKVGHHGSRQSINSAIIAELKPEFALISVGEGNSYGHPSKDTLQALEECGSKILRTDEHGVVELRFSENGISVTSER